MSIVVMGACSPLTWSMRDRIRELCAQPQRSQPSGRLLSVCQMRVALFCQATSGYQIHRSDRV
jgi:hypothetical protein